MPEIKMTVDENGTLTATASGRRTAYRARLDTGGGYVVIRGRLDESASKWDYICDHSTFEGARRTIVANMTAGW